MTTITTPPTAPSRSNPSTFSVRADAFVTWLETAVGEFNTVAGEVNTNATAAASAKTAAEAARDAALDAEAGALAGASYAGAWSGLTGALTMPATVKHSDALWTLNTDLADVTASEPGVSGDWTELYDLNVLAVAFYGVSEASKAVIADADGNVKFSEEIQAKAYMSTVAALSGTTPTINCNVANSFTLTTIGNTTITLDASGIDLDTNGEWTGTLKITAGGTHTLAFSAGGGSVKFARGIQPDAPVSGETDVYVITTSDGVNFTVLSVLAGAVVAPPAFQDAAWYANHKTKRYFAKQPILGPELVTNGTFDSDTDWTKGTGWTISGGTASHSGAGGDVRQNISCVIGRTYIYRITLDASEDGFLSNTAVQIRNSANTSSVVQVSSAGLSPLIINQVYLVFVATEENYIVRCFSEDDISIDNISVREVTGFTSMRPVTFSDLHTYERASTATYFDASGTLQTAAVDEPRYDYDPATGQALGLLVEESSTNLLTYSVPDAAEPTNWTDFSTGTVGKTLATLQNGMQGIRFQSDGNRPRISQAVSVSPSTTYTISVRVDDAWTVGSGDQNERILRAICNGTGSITSVASYVDISDGFLSVVVTTAADTTTITVQYGPGIDIVTTGDDIVMGGIQLEPGSVPTSYIPTTGSPVTRAADVLTRTPAQFPFASMPSALSLHMLGDMSYADTVTNDEAVLPFKWHVDNNNRIRNRLSVVSGSDTGQWIFQQTASGANDDVGSGANTVSGGINVPFSIASRHGETFINGAVDGTVLTADLTPAALPDLSATTMQIAPTFNGHIAVESGWVTDIGDTRLGEITA